MRLLVWVRPFDANAEKVTISNDNASHQPPNTWIHKYVYCYDSVRIRLNILMGKVGFLTASVFRSGTVILVLIPNIILCRIHSTYLYLVAITVMVKLVVPIGY